MEEGEEEEENEEGKEEEGKEEEENDNEEEEEEENNTNEIVKIELQNDILNDEDEINIVEENYKKEEESESKSNKKICFHCGKEGHIERKCPELNPPKPHKEKPTKNIKEINIKRKVRNELIAKHNRNKSNSRNILKNKEQRKINQEIKEKGEGFF